MSSSCAKDGNVPSLAAGATRESQSFLCSSLLGAEMPKTAQYLSMRSVSRSAAASGCPCRDRVHFGCPGKLCKGWLHVIWNACCPDRARMVGVMPNTPHGSLWNAPLCAEARAGACKRPGTLGAPADEDAATSTAGAGPCG
eukprot:6239692-Alexandrium_andersonii.AAC.1